MKKLLTVVATAATLSLGQASWANSTEIFCDKTVTLIRSIGTAFEENIGDVNVSCDGYTLEVMFDTSSGSAGDGTFNLLETNVHVEEYGAGEESLCVDLPQNRNLNPQPGKFNTPAQSFKISDGVQMAAHFFTISGIGSVVIAAHAAVRNEDPPPPFDEAWGYGEPFGGASGATCFMVSITD